MELLCFPTSQKMSLSPSSLKPVENPDAPPPLLQQVQSRSNRGGFRGFTQQSSSDRSMNSLGTFNGNSFNGGLQCGSENSAPIYRWKLNGYSLNVPESQSYALILPIIKESFRSAPHPGTEGRVMICAESGSSKVKASSFTSIAHVHVCIDPFDLLKEVYAAAVPNGIAELPGIDSAIAVLKRPY
ncbi:hypothetical protein H6P81_002322 [Aristolochia fimbriata]|uniref:Uncharacterized protein n=1 Tax=Aristolochia fimbriata TaxID=158543 RepID=A0AAV7FA06_ARIFI|nr:hypothetical protein H6P81_002322 [Aristolochia fimbriata]